MWALWLNGRKDTYAAESVKQQVSGMTDTGWGVIVAGVCAQDSVA
jgi:hypothetical protein